MKTKTKTRNAKRIMQVSEGQFEEAMEKYAVAGRREAEINRCIETEVNDILHTYEDELTCISQGRNMAFEMIQSYCLDNKHKLFASRRSIGTLHGIAGFRLGMPRLKTVKGEKWDSVVEKLREKLPAYVRTAYEPARDLLVADRHKENVAPLLVQIGLEVVQDELFFIELKNAA